MATTSPDNIWTPDAGDAYALTTDLAATADSVQDAITALRTEMSDADSEHHILVRRRGIGATNTFSNQTTWANFPQTADRDALAANFVKVSDDTKLVVQVTGGCELASGVAQAIFLGVNIGGTDYEVARTRFLQATYLGVLVGEIEIPSLAAGTYAINARFRAGSSSIVNFTTSDAVSWSITETR